MKLTFSSLRIREQTKFPPMGKRKPPHQLHQKPLHSAKVTAWCVISSSGIIGPYFFQDSNEIATTITSAHYVRMIQTFFTQELTQFSQADSAWFQKDQTTSHTGRKSINTINQLFPNHVISRKGDSSWPETSPDLSACDCFLWGYLKIKVYAHRPQNIAELKLRIREEISRVLVRMLCRVMRNTRSRLEECLSKGRGHLEDVVFKK
jgi:hypothetical protein